MPSRFLLATAALLLAPCAASGAAQLSFAHYAPGAGPVTLQLNDREPLALDYKTFVPVAEYEADRYDLAAYAEDGRVLAEGSLHLRNDDRYVVILAGNGSQAAPYQWRLAVDHNHPFLAGQSSLQSASLAIVPPIDFSPAPPQTTAECSNGSTASTGYEAFGEGTFSLAGEGNVGAFTMEANRPSCVHRAAGTAGISQIVVSAQPGERLRRFLIGDDIHEPVELVLVRQGREAVKPVMAPDASLEGLWSVAGESNTGLQVAFDRDAPAEQRLSAVFFGFDPAGSATWRTLEGLRLIEYVGGNVDGTRGAVGFERAPQAMLTAHSCREMTLIIPSEDPAAVFPLPPRNALTLRRLFPTSCPPAVRQPEMAP